MTAPGSRKNDVARLVHISMEGDRLEEAKFFLRELPDKMGIAASRALNRTVQGVRAETVRQVRQRYFVQARRVRETMKISKASPGRLEAILVSRGGNLPLSRFRVNPKAPVRQRGVRVSARRRIRVANLKTTSPVRLDRAFVARWRTGHVGVYQWGKGKSKDRVLKEKYGPSVPGMAGSENVSGFILGKAQDRMGRELSHEIGRLLEEG